MQRLLVGHVGLKHGRVWVADDGDAVAGVDASRHGRGCGYRRKARVLVKPSYCPACKPPSRPVSLRFWKPRMSATYGSTGGSASK